MIPKESLRQVHIGVAVPYTSADFAIVAAAFREGAITEMQSRIRSTAGRLFLRLLHTWPEVIEDFKCGDLSRAADVRLRLETFVAVSPDRQTSNLRLVASANPAARNVGPGAYALMTATKGLALDRTSMPFSSADGLS